MRIKIEKILINCIFAIQSILTVGIVLVNLIYNAREYTCKKYFLLNEVWLLIIGMLIIFGIIRLGTHFNKKISCSEKTIRTASIILFLVQGYIFYNIYFATGWDAGWVVYQAHIIADGATDGLDHFYFSRCPNNQMLVWVLSLIFRLNNNLFGIFDIDNGLMFGILIQCLLTTIGGYLLYKVIKNCTNSELYSWMGWMLYVLLLGLSGWNVIIYTDMMGLIFPIAILRIYQTLKNDRKVYLKWFMIVTLSFWGFKMKPTALIIFIAIVIVELVHLLDGFNREKAKKIVLLITISIMITVIYSNSFKCIIESTGLQINDEVDMGALHMVMMGLNPERDGVYYEPDVQLSIGIASKAERKAKQIEVIRQRLHDYGIVGFLEHLRNKSLVIFNDGSFAWGVEGNFYSTIYNEKNKLASPFYRSIYYDSSERNQVLLTIEQIFWLASLTLSAGIAMAKRNKITEVISLSLTGIIIFNFTFEARARYLVLYVPFFIIAGCIALQERADRS